MPTQNRRQNDNKSLSTKVTVLEGKFEAFETKYELDRKENKDNWSRFFESREEELLANTKKPTTYKEIIATVAATVSVVLGLDFYITSKISYQTAVYAEQVKQTAHKVETIDDTLNNSVKTLALLNAQLSRVSAESRDNKEFVEDYIFVKEIPARLTGMEKDLEHLKSVKGGK